MADHQVAQVYCPGGGDLDALARQLAEVDGVAEVLCGARGDLDHPRAGDLVLVAEPGAWFTYDWWVQDERAPDYARTVDIHRKPGYDPCELLMEPGLMTKAKVVRKLIAKKFGFRTLFDVIPLRPEWVGGSHGRIDVEPMRRPVLLDARRLGPSSPWPLCEMPSFSRCLTQTDQEPPEPVGPEFFQLVGLFDGEQCSCSAQLSRRWCINQQAGIRSTHLQQDFEFEITQRASGDGSIEVGDGITPRDHMQSDGRSISKQFFELLVRCGGPSLSLKEKSSTVRSPRKPPIRGGSALWWGRLPCRWQVGLSLGMERSHRLIGLPRFDRHAAVLLRDRCQPARQCIFHWGAIHHHHALRV